MGTHLLWTGGWDSTFRILQLALIRKQAVQPHYVLDLKRRSSLHELRAIQTIREHISGKDKAAAARIEPLRVVTTADLPDDLEARACLARLRERGHLGHQYVFLASYAAHAGIDGLEICIHADDHAERVLRNHVIRVEDSSGGYWRLDVHKGATNDEMLLFARFRFPLLEMTKLEMRRVASEMGLLHIMEATWFCHTPSRTQPCGRCAPCIYTIEEGLSDRLPRRALLRYQLRSLEPLGRLPGRAVRGVKAPRTVLQRLLGRRPSDDRARPRST